MKICTNLLNFNHLKFSEKTTNKREKITEWNFSNAKDEINLQIKKGLRFKIKVKLTNLNWGIS